MQYSTAPASNFASLDSLELDRLHAHLRCGPTPVTLHIPATSECCCYAQSRNLVSANPLGPLHVAGPGLCAHLLKNRWMESVWRSQFAVMCDPVGVQVGVLVAGHLRVAVRLQRLDGGRGVGGGGAVPPVRDLLPPWVRIARSRLASATNPQHISAAAADDATTIGQGPNHKACSCHRICECQET